MDYGIKILKMILESWIKKTGEVSGNFEIFLPKVSFENDVNYLAFPVFKEAGENYKLVKWRRLNLNTSKIEDDMRLNGEFFADKSIFDFSNENNKFLLYRFAEIYKLFQKVKKNEADPEELKKLMKNYNVYLQDKLDDSIKELYFGRKEVKITKVESSVPDLTELNFSKKEEREEYTVDEIFERINNIETLENVDYDFEWNLETGLRFVSDEMIDIICKILEKGEVSISKGEKKINIKSKVKKICETYLTNKELIEKIDSGELLGEKGNPFHSTPNHYENYVCLGCKFDRCPKYYTAYVLYLKNKNLLKDKLIDREEFRKNEFKSDYFSFKWEPDIGLEKVIDKTFDYCMALVEKGRIIVAPNLENNNIKIHMAYKCAEVNGEISRIPEDNLEYKRWTSITRSKDKLLLFCNTYSCRLDGCPFTIAGYIYYLLKEGKGDEIKAAREYYAAHKEQIDKEFYEAKEEKLKSLEEKKNKNVDSLKQFSDKIKNIESLADDISIKNQKNLHIVLEGNDKEVKIKCEDAIKEVLISLEKIKSNDKSFQRISLQKLASRNAYFNSTAGNSNKEKRNGVDKNGEYYEISSEAVYTEIEEKKLFVLNGIEEFVHDYKLYKSMGSSGYKEIRIKQFTHIIDMLTNLSAENYIILDGSEEEVNGLLDLDVKLKFVFGGNRYKVENTSVEEMFEIYSKNIKPELLDDFRKNEESIKKQFIEFVSMNKEFIPFSEIELSKYLSSYANSKNNIEFPANVYKRENVEESLKSIIGMETVKKKVKEFEKYALYTVKAKALGINLQKSNLHMVFTGNPGTGKTTIARIMAKMLYDLGLIKENKLIEVERKDLVAGYIGQTATKTAEVLDKAMGGVLFIDEAYTLASGTERDFGPEAIATIIKTMEDRKDEIVIIFAGYRNEMQSFLELNPGITSRIGYTFDFPDYSAKELTEIFERKTSNMGYKLDKNVENKVKGVCDYFVRRKNFGNGRFIDKVIQETVMKHALNESSRMDIISEKDIPTIENLTNAETSKNVAEELLENLVGMEDLKVKIREFESYIKFIKEAEKRKINVPTQNMHMIFTGNPGTGKTTVARIIAEILFNLGIIHENRLVEVERKDLIAGYIGQTATKTAEVIDRAMGGVLFIDEAYTLASGYERDFGPEAIATLIKAMEDHKGEFVVIFAGYRNEMQGFLNLNPGIASRIGYTFDFPDYTAEEYCEIYYRKIAKMGFSIDDSAKEDIEKLMKYFCNVENIGNGRFVDRVVQETLIKQAKNSNKDITVLTKEAIPTIQDITKNLFNGNNMINPTKIDEEALRRVAVHEIGHATIRYLLAKTPGIKKITINAEGTGTLGYVRYSVSDDIYSSSKSTKLNEICMKMGGIAAEQVFYGEFASGGWKDIEQATQIAREMITLYGMSDLGFSRIFNPDGALANSVYNETNKFLKECFDKSVKYIEENKTKVSNLADYIMEHKEIDEEQFIKIFDKKERKSSSKK